ncbi:MAG: penicillin-binding transpeptidase domain-containing protein [Verrucomicrobiota bacterium]
MIISNQQIDLGLRIGVINIAIFAAVIILVSKLFYVQLREGDKYTESLKSQTTVSVLLSPARGGIYDRNGIGLAENRASLDIDVYLREMVGHYARNQQGKLPKTTYKGRQLANVPEILEQSTGDIFKTLALPVDYSNKDLLRHYDQKPNIPFQLANDLDFSTLSRFSEHSMNIPGIQETARPVRYYTFGALAPHILGYVGAVEEQKKGVFIESIGKEGIEKTFDAVLQGKPGRKVLKKNNVGYILGVEAVEIPTIGSSVYTSIDAHFQHIAEQAMRNNGVGRGTCVITDIWSGDILAMVSVPNYDPNIFIPSIDSASLKQLSEDPTGPLHHRAISAYNPASTFKTLITLAALSNPEANFTPQTFINSPGAIYGAGRWWNDWYEPGRGSINMHTALQWSTNTFYYQLAVRTGIKSIVNTAKQLGFNQHLLVDGDGQALVKGESKGIVAGPEWMNAQEDRRFAYWRSQKEKDPDFKFPRTWRERWSDGHTMNTAIGQGFTQVSAVQLTTMMGAIANGGKIYLPRLIRAVKGFDETGTEMIEEYPIRLNGTLDIKPEHLQAVQQGLRAVVTGGTGGRANARNYAVAGKTGTAQAWSIVNGRRVTDNRALFNGYAPYDNPKYAITVIIEGGTSGGRDTGPVVKEIFEKIAKLEKGSSIDLVYLSPAVGHFRGVQAVNTEDQIQPLEELYPELPAGQQEEPQRRRSFWQRLFNR